MRHRKMVPFPTSPI